MKMGKRNQIYARYVRIMSSTDNPNEIYLVLEKDSPMDRKYIRQFDNMFAGKDVILTIGVLIRSKNGRVNETEESTEEVEPKEKQGKKGEDDDESKNISESPFWSVDD